MDVKKGGVTKVNVLNKLHVIWINMDDGVRCIIVTLRKNNIYVYKFSIYVSYVRLSN